MDRQPTLAGARVHLRPLRADDYDALFAAASDPLIWEQHPDERWREDVFRGFFDGALASGGALAAIDATYGRIVGTSRFEHYDPARREVEIGWTFLARSHWGGGFNGEMKRLMLQHAFQYVDRVVFVIYSTNFRSRRAVEKIGGTLIEKRPDLARGGTSFVYAITANALQE